MTHSKRRQHPLLIVLGVVFACRVVAQYLSTQVTSQWLPSFDQWSSGLVTYPWLLAMQIFVLGMMIRGAGHRLHAGVPVEMAGFLRAFALIYYLVMLMRLVIALGGFSDHYWLQLPLPAAFHLVLASYLYCYASYPRQTETSGGELKCILR